MLLKNKNAVLATMALVARCALGESGGRDKQSGEEAIFNSLLPHSCLSQWERR